MITHQKVFITPLVHYCEGRGISPPFSRNLRFFVGMLGMSQLEILNYQEFYDSFMKLPASPTGAWVSGRVVREYPLDWWNGMFDTADHQKFTTTFPNFREIQEMVESHFLQLVSHFPFSSSFDSDIMTARRPDAGDTSYIS